jgi:aminopeptidase N
MSDATDTASLTQREAEERAALLRVRRYDIAVDLTGLLDGDTVRSVSTITFDCLEPGAATFVDCVAEVSSATLNGQELDLRTVERGRLPLTGLAAENVLVVAAFQSDTASSAGILRTVDPSDKLVYVWMSFEADDARRVWACFDQPDLKAPHAFTVTAPESWTVTSNDAPDEVGEPTPDAARVWRFPDTPSLSTYVVVINAGPFHELRRELGGYDLGLYSRQSTARFLEQAADELFDLTARGLAFFGERFDLPFPQRRYDQVFVPDMGGAMENWGCVTWTDSVLFRSTPTFAMRQRRAEILLHEMAHMWFGDLVTMRWWDDLWLNEAFASWAASWAAAGATEFTHIWATFLAADKIDGYRQDMGPATHPIRGEVPDVSVAMANFDDITYVKGQSVLRQLAVHVGEDAFVAGLRAYFHEHAWDNTTLSDLIDAVAAAAGRDLSGWTTDWLDRDGTDTLTLSDGSLDAAAPEGEARPHTLVVGSYVAGDDGLRLVGATPVTTTGRRTPLTLPVADLHLVNDDDLTFAAARPDASSVGVMLTRGGDLPSPMSRAVAVSTAYDMLVKGELPTGGFLTCVLGVLETERTPGVVEPFLVLAQQAAEEWTPAAEIENQRAAVAEAALRVVDHPDLRTAGLQVLAGCAVTDTHFAMLAGPAEADTDLGWRLLTRRAELGEYDEDGVRALLARDPDPDAGQRAVGVLAARPVPEAKEQVWHQVFTERAIHAGPAMRIVGRSFWRPGQEELLRPFTGRYLEELDRLDAGAGGMLETMSLVWTMYPHHADAEFADRAEAAAEESPPSIRTALLTETDSLRRKLRARRA